MADISWKKLACIGFISVASLISGCGNKEKVAVVDVQKLQQESVQIQSIQKEITDKNIEIQKRIDADAQAGIADEEMQKKLSIYSAFELYLDFINIFLYILRFVGNRD